MFRFPIPPSLQKSLSATKVEYVKLGNSGLRVSWPILGAMSFGASPMAAWLLDEEAAFKVLEAAYDCGINTWDTANAYSNGLSEEIIGNFIKKFEIPRERVVIMTKCAFHVGEEQDVIGAVFSEQLNQSKDYVNQGAGLTRMAIFKAVDDSLERLGTKYIDLLQIQRYDASTPPEETMKALHDLVQAGKVRYLGASSMWATQFAQLQFIAERNNWTKFISMQNYYNLCYREEEREMNRFCKETGVGLIPWSPLYAGRLARPVGYDKSARSKRPSPHHPSITSNDEEIINRVEKIATKNGWKMSEVALVWHKRKGTVPIVGFNSIERIEEAAGLRGKLLTDEDIAYLEEPYIARPVAGHS
ncbi:NADP-dependent oxidoreductase domain-containing protein [Talaromyces proteolyticus]|uniref:NADP-dependent oxidoreductase domain-containing protein n=1 Tax=Talaromyces proteolyticus TaxID=1131652 RepID=A0AAD4KMY6_9EURO|nr:NADP-dependent oxidoreductase domain-containing protein [Talaromyces proteolyticus]KAH8695287.1 NADP-dependent oxidoreductase domain-containing protein [Talaromyces proteolyticus]